MFGGAGVYRDGVFFALATSDGGIYLKCDAEIEPRFRAAGSQPVHLRPRCRERSRCRTGACRTRRSTIRTP